MDAHTASRKDDHLRINLEKGVKSSLTNGFEAYRFRHQALPEIDLAEVDTSLTVFGERLRSPLLISSMTGGTQKAAHFNQLLARAAQEFGLAIGVGSQRAALEDPSLEDTFRITRQEAPDALLFANLGAVQLNMGYGISECQRAVNMLAANALILHLNPLQEALQPEGDTQFHGLLKRIEEICRKLPVPVIAKEVGWGIGAAAAKQLLEAGVAAIDVAGAGGTSWSQVEMYRQKDPQRAQMVAHFQDWGIPTAQCLAEIKQEIPNACVFASGGLQNGIDLAKSLALGATLGGIAGPLLRAANEGYDQLAKTITLILEELRICMFATGKKTLTEFNQSVLTLIR
ncbi:MAG TPA: type 2 isopentenyl-diphosphate Delta-isomerase [Anaerolineaceae bacterium]|nr:type 2 isopentenyl-diphosphate Delta-isomerase [Anaerolineaceae bacterium]